MACLDSNFITGQKIPFVAQLQIPCGYWLNPDELYNVDTPQELTYNFFIDKHCVFCVKRCVKKDVAIPGTNQTCPISVDATSLIGALHYDFVIPDFHVTKPELPEVKAALTSTQSICVEDLPICYDCTAACTDPVDCSKIAYECKLLTAKLFTNTQQAGVDLLKPSGLVPNYLTNKFTSDGFNGLKVGNSNGCKTIVISGEILITKTA